MALIRVDIYGRIKFASAGCASVGGISAEHLEGSNLWQHAHRDDAEELEAYFAGSPPRLSGTRVQLRYRRRMLGVGAEDEALSLFFTGEWVSVAGTASELELAGIERRLGVHNEDDPGPVEWDLAVPPPDVGPDPRKVEAQRREAERKEARDRAARHALRSAYFELNNALHGVNTVALALRDNIDSMRAEAASAGSAEWIVMAPLQLQQDVQDLVAAGKAAELVQQDIRVLDRAESGPGSGSGSGEAFPLFAKLKAVCDGLALLAACGRGGLMLVLDGSVPVLPVMEGADLVVAIQSAVSHGMRLAGADRVLVRVGVHSEHTSRLLAEVVHASGGLTGVTMEKIRSAIDAPDAGGLAELTNMRAERLRLMASVMLELARQIDGTVDISERGGMLRVALSVPWRPASKEAVADSGLAELEASARAAHVLAARSHAPRVEALLAADGAAAAAALTESAVRVSETAASAAPAETAARAAHADVSVMACLTAVPDAFVAAGASAALAAGSPVPTLLPASPDDDDEAPDATDAPGGAAPGATGGRRTRTERMKRREAAQAKREAARAALAGGADAEGRLPRGLMGRPERLPLLGRHVLLVDDMAVVRHRGEQILASLGVTCELLEDGDEIRDALRHTRHPFDAILLDIIMPRMKGDVMCRQLRNELHFKRPIIAMTGHTDPTDLVRYYDKGFDVVLAKPLSVDAVASALLESMLRRGNTQRIKRVAARIGDSVDSKEVLLETGGEGDVPSASVSSRARGLTVGSVQPHMYTGPAMRAAAGKAASGDRTPGIRGTLDEPLGVRDRELMGVGGLGIDLTGDEPVLGLQRGATIGMEGASGAGGRARVMGQRAATSAMTGSHRHIHVLPPGRIDG